MENILLGIILSSLILQTLLVRHFLKQLLHKLSNEISFAKSNSTISSVIPSQLNIVHIFLLLAFKNKNILNSKNESKNNAIKIPLINIFPFFDSSNYNTSF